MIKEEWQAEEEARTLLQSETGRADRCGIGFPLT